MLIRCKFFKTIHFLIFFLWIATLFSQKTEAKLYFKDGSERVGFAKFKGKEKVKFRETKQDKSIIYNWEDLRKVTLTKPGNGRYHFYYKKIKGAESYKPLQLISDGKIKLYRVVTKGYDVKYDNGRNTLEAFSNNTTIPKTTRTETENFYISKDGEEVIDLSQDSDFSRNFKETSTSFFSDCKEIVSKINEGKYTLDHIRDIVFYYNFKCD